MVLRRDSRELRSNRGFVLVTVAIFMFVLILMAGFAVDLGSWYLSASKLQRATDSAALAAASSLPDEAEARVQALAVLERNGYPEKANLKFDIQSGPTNVTVKVTDGSVPTYFLKMIKDHLTVSRESSAKKGARAPALGSPYNVLGTGSLPISNIPQQNFWLAVNGMCSPKEDGDYFNAAFDANKGPFTGEFDKDHNAIQAPDARHHCPANGYANSVNNPDHHKNGYNYFVDIPPITDASVSISVFDGSTVAWGSSNRIDSQQSLQKDVLGLFNTKFLVYDTNGTPENSSDDGEAVGGAMFFSGDTRPGAIGGWYTLYTATSDKIKNGGQYRVQVFIEDPYDIYYDHNYGVNAFALGAFRNGNTAQGCDTREQPTTCPRVYGRSAMSVYNSLSVAGTKQVTYYFADIDESFVGSSMRIFMWDPGEGTKKLEILGPDGTPLRFDWDSAYEGGVESKSNVQSLDTSGTAHAITGLSNNWKFNDRLVTIRLEVPTEYKDMIAAAGGNTGLQIRYTVNDAPNDRTTWGIAMDDTELAPVHLVNK